MQRHSNFRHITHKGALIGAAAAIFASALGGPASTHAATPAARVAQVAQPSITKSVSQTNANVGDVLVYTLTISNPLPGPIIYNGPLDTLAPNLSFGSATPGHSIPNPLFWNNPGTAVLPAFASTVYTFTAQITECADVLNRASFRWAREVAGQQVIFTQADSNSVGTKVNCEPNLVYSKSVNPASVTVGGLVQWTINVTNTGGAPATYYGPYDNLPPNVTFVDATPGYSGPNPVYWNPTGTVLAAGASAIYTITATAKGPCGEPIKNTALVEAQGGGMTNETVTEVICPQGVPKIVIEKEVSALTAAISNTLVYTLKVTNSGTAAGSYYGPFDSLPLGNATFQSATPGYSGPNPIKWNSPTPKPIAVGATDVYTIAMHVDGPCGATFYNRAFVEGQFPIAVSNVVSTTVICPTGWKIATPQWVPHTDVFTYVIALENTTDQPMTMSWNDAQLRVNPNQRSPYGVLPADFDGNVVIEIGAPPTGYANAITGPCRPPYLCDYVFGQPAANVLAAKPDASGVSWTGSVPARTRLLWPIPVLVGVTPPCGKEIKNTVVITNADGTISYGVAVAKVMCPDLGDAPDSSNHYGNPMRIAPFGQPSPGARYPSVFDSSAAGDEGPIHRLAGSNSNLFTGAPANAIDASLGYRFVQQTPLSPVSNERDADWLPDQEPFWLKRNILPTPVISNTRSNRDGHDNAFTNPLTNSPLPFFMNACGNGLVRYAQYVNPATPYSLGTRYVNMWVDLNMDGDWGDTITTQCPNGPVTAREWVGVNLVANPVTGIYAIPPFPIGNLTLPKRLWVRISIADTQAPAASVGNGPAAGYLYGETEDHYLCQKPIQGSTLVAYVPCPQPLITVKDLTPDATTVPNRVLPISMNLDTFGDTGPVTVTWSVVKGDKDPVRGWDIKVIKKLALQRQVTSASGEGPVTDVVTNGLSEVELVVFGAGVFEVTATIETADGETEVETITVTAEAHRVQLPFVSRR
jgi:uncharacterized repeat protein (TIGR01451 family)